MRELAAAACTGARATAPVEWPRDDAAHVIGYTTAEALIDLLQRIWLDDIAAPAATAEVRRMMSKQLFSHRLASDLRTDSLRVSAKTGTFLTLRHEIGVVETDTGDQIAIAALTRSSVPVVIQQDLDLAIGAAARLALEVLR